jgi:thiol-disulfide isomerase/thioredoxin
MVKSVEITLYYANWCGHCVRFKPAWEELKENISKLKDNHKKVHIKIEEYEHENLSKLGGGKINGVDIDGYPTIKIKLSHGKEEKEYNFDNYGKERNSEYMTKFITNLCNELANYKK